MTTESGHHRGAEIACFAVTIVEEAAALSRWLDEGMYVRELDMKTYFSESGIVAVVAGTVTAGDRTSTVGFLAGEEASLDFEVSHWAVFSSGVCKGESCEGGREAETDESLHNGNKLRAGKMK